MGHNKSLVLLCLVLLFAVSGCGKKAERDEALSIKRTDLEKIYPAKEQNVGGQVVKHTTPMIEEQRDIVLEEGEILVSDFEGWPNNLGGEMGAYGALEADWDQASLYPVSWVYEAITAGYDPANVHAGNNSFRLVNGLGIKRDLIWGSFSMDLGPTTDLTVVPKKVESLDVSGYKYLVFWVKGEKGGEKMEFLARDSHALNYSPQIKYKLPDSTSDWQKIVVPLDALKGKVDLTRLDNIGLAFGRDVGNMQGDIAYIDDFVFTNRP